MDFNTDTLKKHWDENPGVLIAAVGTLFLGVAKLVDAVSSAQSRRAYAKAVKYRVQGRR